MKFSAGKAIVQGLIVAPHWGAWIEICTAPTVWKTHTQVAPHWGAWIEINVFVPFFLPCWGVAPHWGAWIEMPCKVAS